MQAHCLTGTTSPRQPLLHYPPDLDIKWPNPGKGSVNCQVNCFSHQNFVAQIVQLKVSPPPMDPSSRDTQTRSNYIWRLTYRNNCGNVCSNRRIHSTNSYRYFTDMYRGALHALTSIIRVNTSAAPERVALCLVWRCPTSCQPPQGFPVISRCLPQDQHRTVSRPVIKQKV